MEKSTSPEQDQTVALTYAGSDLGTSRRGRGFLALTATLICPGLGHWIAGRRRRAAFWLLISLISISLFIYLIIPSFFLVALVLMPVQILLFLSMMVDAFLCGRRSTTPMLGRPWRRYAIGSALLLIALFANPQTKLTDFLVRKTQDHVRTFRIGSGSMIPTLAPGDTITAHKVSSYKRWDMVTYHAPGDPSTTLVARIVGLPGEEIEIRPDGLFLNGQVTALPVGVGPYVSVPRLGNIAPSLSGDPCAGCKGYPIRLQPDEYFILGDNSTRALDARLWETSFDTHQLGAIPEDKLEAKVTAIYWPLSRWRTFE